jgi:predicted transcriptional regulator
VINSEKVYERINESKAVAWDTCHKIYILMDDEQVSLMREYGYDPLITADQMSADEMFDTVQEWYNESCSLRFIEAVSTNKQNPNAGFESLISQLEDYEERELV